MEKKEQIKKIKGIIGEGLYNRLSTDWYYQIPFDDILCSIENVYVFYRKHFAEKDIEFDESKFFTYVPKAIEYLKTLPKDAVIELNPDTKRLVYVVNEPEDDEAYKWRLRHLIELRECQLVQENEKKKYLQIQKERLENELADINRKLNNL